MDTLLAFLKVIELEQNHELMQDQYVKYLVLGIIILDPNLFVTLPLKKIKNIKR